MFMETDTQANPLLRDASLLPAFDEITVEHVEPGVLELVREVGGMIDALEASATPNWSGVVEPLEKLQDRLGFGWGLVEHLLSVKNSGELRTAYEKVEPEVVRLSMRLAQSQNIYQCLVALHDRQDEECLDESQKRIVEKLIEEADLAGVGLTGESRQRFNDNKLRFAEASTRFGNQLLDATKAFSLELVHPDEIKGLPPSFLSVAAQSSRDAGHESATTDAGPWRVTLDGPSFVGFMKYSARRDLREKLYRASITRASSGNLDNGPLIDTILRLRREEAVLLGRSTFADLSLSQKMAATVDRAESLLEELRSVCYPAAGKDMEELKAFMRQKGATEESIAIKQWDIPYWSERLREFRFDFSEEEIRVYFPLPRVLNGLFKIAKQLFSINVVEADGEAGVWHKDVRFFRVETQSGEHLASFYMDPYSRPSEKRGGAWMNEVVGRSKLFLAKDRSQRKPVAYLICNGSVPVDGRPSLMTFREIETLFHEFGHTLQHMLTEVDYGLASGIRNIEWDAVELPSQFMENWCYHRETLIGLSEHVETGEPLPEELFKKILEARAYRAGSSILRQLYFGMLDLELHHRFDLDGSESPFDVQRRVSELTTVLAPIPEDRFLCSFSHIFQGGYAAGYYSYLWAQVLSADAFSAFEEVGVEDLSSVRELGQRFRETILGLGGSIAPLEVFKMFRGREPSTQALLKHSNLV